MRPFNVGSPRIPSFLHANANGRFSETTREGQPVNLGEKRLRETGERIVMDKNDPDCNDA